MDTSDQYIKMCDTPEIQRHWQFGISGDFVFSPEKNRTAVLYYNKAHGQPPEEYLPPKSIWLPRADQLADLFGIGTRKLIEGLDEFHIFSNPYNPKVWWDESLEKVILVYMMWKKHRKIWTNLGWTKHDE